MIQHQHRLLRFGLSLLAVVAIALTSIGSSSASNVPVISIVSVEADKSVTIAGSNFPVGQKFVVRMGAYGTYALGGEKVGKVETEQSTFTTSFDIPEGLKGDARIAIRLDSDQGYYAYNWFYNATAAADGNTTDKGGYTGYPTFTITDVERNMAVDIEITNLPADQTFTVKMGEYLTMGLGGIEAGTFESGEGGSLKKTFSIPAALADRSRIAIRFDSPEGYYAYNWFWNSSTGAPATGGEVEPVASTYSGIPLTHIDAVVKDTSVTISGSNFPADQTFKVTMGEYGKKGIGGIEAGSYESGKGGDFTQTFDIPKELAGSYRIAIRLETSDGMFYSYNWFFNNTTE